MREQRAQRVAQLRVGLRADRAAGQHAGMCQPCRRFGGQCVAAGGERFEQQPVIDPFELLQLRFQRLAIRPAAVVQRLQADALAAQQGVACGIAPVALECAEGDFSVGHGFRRGPRRTEKGRHVDAGRGGEERRVV